MYPATITAYRAPTNLTDALEVLAGSNSRVRVLAGGQSALQRIRSRTDRPDVLLDLRRIPRLSDITTVGADGAILGPLARYRELVSHSDLRGRWAALTDAAEHIGDRQVRNRGTLGGNLSFADITGDLGPPCIALAAQVTLESLDTQRILPVEEFFVAPNQTVLASGELLTRITLPAPEPGGGSAYEKYGITFNGRAVIGVAANVRIDQGGRCEDARIVVGGVRPRPFRCTDAENVLIGSSPDGARLHATADVAAEQVPVHDDLRASAVYRTQLVRVYTRRVLEAAIDRARKA